MTMNKNTPEKRPQMRRKRRRSYGVPTALAAGLIALALFFGGLLGFLISNQTNGYRSQLETAQARIAELEGQLGTTSTDGGDAGSDSGSDWNFETGAVDSFADFGDLADASASADGESFWNSANQLEGMLTDTGESVVVAEFEGGEVTSDEVIEPYNSRIATIAFGFGDDSESTEETLQTVLEELVEEKVAYQHAEALGLTELTDEDIAAVTATAQELYDQQKNFNAASVDTSGMTAEEADAAVEAYMTEQGITLESLIETEEADYWREKLFDATVESVTATDEEIQAEYDALLADQTERFGQSSAEYEFAVSSGETIVYNLEGYRRVKQILLTFDDTDTAAQAQELTNQIAELNAETDFDQITALQEQLDALYTDLDAEAEAIIEQINSGADFETLMAQYNEDSGANYEPVRTQGYYVSANTTQYASDFVEASMMLEQPGQVSTPIHTVDGVHIILYVADVTPGEVSLEDAREAVTEDVLEEKRQTYYDEQVAQWVADANPQYYPDRMQ